VTRAGPRTVADWQTFAPMPFRERGAVFANAAKNAGAGGLPAAAGAPLIGFATTRPVVAATTATETAATAGVSACARTRGAQAAHRPWGAQARPGGAGQARPAGPQV
jgi:hypothetical protein